MHHSHLDREDVRLLVYRELAATGRAPDRSQLARAFDASEEEVRAALSELAGARHLVLDDSGAIIMAHPFSAVPLGFSVMGRGTLWWGGCAWDAFAVPHLVAHEPDVLVATTCPGCNAPHAWVVDRHAPPPGRQVAHFLVPVAAMWDDVVHTCRHQRLYCSERCVERWLAATGRQPGYVMDLHTLWRLARGWYAGRLDRGYLRREPSQAREYFRSVGLSGPFWDL